MVTHSSSGDGGDDGDGCGGGRRSWYWRCNMIMMVAVQQLLRA